MAHLVRMALFFGGIGVGLWAFQALNEPWNWVSFLGAFLIGGVASMVAFRKLANASQRKADLEARLHND